MANFGDPHPVSGAGWNVFWRLPPTESGLEIWWADFHGRRVMWRGSAPFAIVPYHRPHPGTEPPGPQHSYKDGLDPRCGGASFRPLLHTAENSGKWWSDPSADAAVDMDAVVVKVEPADDFNPERLNITAKFQCGWYQYVHSWEFSGDGAIHPKVAMGGMLNPFCPSTAHMHNFYFRVDLDIDGAFPNDVFEVFDHKSLNPAGDQWQIVAAQGNLLTSVDTARKWRVRNTKAKNANGILMAYEIEVPQMAGRSAYSTGDVWVTIYRGDSIQQGENVGLAACSDLELETSYAVGPLDTANGSDVVVWVCVRAHHEPRNESEEITFLPYHYEEFSIVPRGFEVFRKPDRGQGGQGSQGSQGGHGGR